MVSEAITALAACVDSPVTCTDQGKFFTALQQAASAPPDASVIDLIARGVINGVGSCHIGSGTPDDPFCAFPVSAIDILRIHAPANPDVAVIQLIQIMEAVLGKDFDAQSNDGPNGIFANAITGVVENLPRTIGPDVRSRALLFFKTLSDLGSRLPATATQAQAALQQLVVKTLPVPLPVGVSPRARARNVVLALGGIGLVGTIAYVFWRISAGNGRRTL